MKVITLKKDKVRARKIKQIIETAGNQICSAWFVKRSDGSLRKMAFRRHVKNPTYAPLPNSKYFKSRKTQDSKNMQLTVLDVNKVLRAKSGRRKGKISGRGAFRTIPLENVKRLCVAGTIYKILS